MGNKANEMTDKLAINQVDHEMDLKKYQVKGYDCLWLVIMSTGIELHPKPMLIIAPKAITILQSRREW